MNRRQRRAIDAMPRVCQCGRPATVRIIWTFPGDGAVLVGTKCDTCAPAMRREKRPEVVATEQQIGRPS